MIIGAACLLSGQLACLKGSLPAYKAACLLTRQLACLQGRGCTLVDVDFAVKNFADFIRHIPNHKMAPVFYPIIRLYCSGKQ
jgi:hypothetical protein